MTLQQAARAPDGQGGATVTWSDVATVFANVQPLVGQEAVVSRQLQDSLTHKVTMRWRGGVKAAMRLKWGTRLFNIREVRNIDERNHVLELRCDEGVAT